MAIEFADRIRRIPVYPVAGGYALEEPVVLLASNESPYPPLPAVREAIDHELSHLNRYPDPSCARLRRSLSDRYGVPAERIAVGNGSCDILLASAEALLEPGAEVVYAWPSFSVYPQLAASSGARAITVKLDAEDRHDLPAMLREITVATRLALVCNPNNPTSTALPSDEIASFLEQVPSHVCVFLDEAYCEFNLLDDPDASIELLDRHPNLVLLRTFSKVHGLAGCASASRCAARRNSRGRSTRSASPSASAPSPRRRRSRRCATRTRSSSGSTRAVVERNSMERGPAGARASPRPTRRPTSAGCAWASRPTRLRSSGACSSAVCWCERGRRWVPTNPPCGSPTGYPRRTPASWTPSARCWPPPRRPPRAAPGLRWGPRAAGRGSFILDRRAIVCYKSRWITMHRTAREYHRTAATTAVWSPFYAWRFS